MIDERVRRVAGTVLGAVLAISLTGVVGRKHDPPAPAVVRVTTPADPLEVTLRAHAAALLRGDEAGWLRPIGPRLRGRYHGIYRTLRAMRVSAFDYHLGPRVGGRQAVDISYCFTGDPCPAYGKISQSLKVGDGPVITGVGRSASPVPWEGGDLVVREGRRVTVAAPRELADRLPRAVRLADRAAVVDDRYAVMIGNRRHRYRLYLATAKAWRSWYGTELDEWVAGYMHPGGDAVIAMASIHSDAELRHVIQHELGHVATIGGAEGRERWLSEGLAEYIARVTPDTGAPRRGNTIVTKLPRRASAGQARAFYARSHLAVQCMAAMYGERAMVEFAGLRLRRNETLAEAANAAFGKPFSTVDKACLAWIGNRLVTS